MAPGFSMAPTINITCLEIVNLYEGIEYLVYNEPRRSSLGPCQGPPTGKLGFAQGALSDRRRGGHTQVTKGPLCSLPFPMPQRFNDWARRGLV